MVSNSKELIKNSEISGDKPCKFKYTFQVKPMEISKVNRRLGKADIILLDALKRSHYIRYYTLPTLTQTYLTDTLDCLSSLQLNKWYHNSLGISYIYDNLTTKAHTHYNKLTGDLELSVNILYQEFLDYSVNTLLQKRLHKDKMLEVCRWYIYNMHRAKSKGKVGFIYHRSKGIYLEMKDSFNMTFPYKVMINLIDFLLLNKTIMNLTGYNLETTGEGDPVLSMIIFTDGTYNIVSEDEIPEPIYPLDLVQVRDINKANMPIDPEWIEYVEDSVKLLTGYRGQMKNSEVKVNGHIVPDIWLRRINTLGIDLGGRFFDQGQYQQFDKVSRSSTEIDGELTCSLDFTALHPSLLYEVLGETLDKDPYPDLKLKQDKVLINKYMKYYGLSKYNPARNLCKLILLCMINASDKKSAISAVVHKMYNDRGKIGNIKREGSIKFCGLNTNPSIGKIMDIIENHNKVIARYFYTGVGLKLMKLDSEIIKYVLIKCIENNIVILPLHDEAICKISDKDKVRDFMIEGYELVMGSRLNCNISED